MAAGFFLFGLALWDKALFECILSGMALATLAIFPKELWKSFSRRNLAVAAIAFCSGAAPLILYNVRVPLNTFRSNAAYSTEQFAEKRRNLASAFSGRALFGFLVRNDPSGQPRNPRTPVERLSVKLSDAAGRPESGVFGYAVLAALLVTPWLRSASVRRIVLFCFLTMLTAWLQMVFTKGAGMATHHVILLWPFPALLTAVAFAEASHRLGRLGKPLLAIAVLFLMSKSLLVTNEYLARLVRNGAGLVWTDAIYPLSDYLQRAKCQAIYLDDWGMFNNLRLLNRGALPLRDGFDPLSKAYLDNDDRRIVLDRISEKGAVFVAHTADSELFKGVNANLLVLAGEGGYQRQMLSEIADRNGRPIFEVFRFTPVAR